MIPNLPLLSPRTQEWIFVSATQFLNILLYEQWTCCKLGCFNFIPRKCISNKLSFTNFDNKKDKSCYQCCITKESNQYSDHQYYFKNAPDPLFLSPEGCVGYFSWNIISILKNSLITEIWFNSNQNIDSILKILACIFLRI